MKNPNTVEAIKYCSICGSNHIKVKGAYEYFTSVICHDCKSVMVFDFKEFNIQRAGIKSCSMDQGGDNGMVSKTIS